MNDDQVCAQPISLDGEWQLRWYDGQRGDALARILSEQPEMHRALTAQVPGSVHLDLMRAGLLDDPNIGLNVLKARWVEENFWHYRRTFTAPALAAGERAYLVLRGPRPGRGGLPERGRSRPPRQRVLSLPPGRDRCAARRREYPPRLARSRALPHRRPALGRLRDEPLRPAAQAQLAAHHPVQLRLGLVAAAAQYRHSRRRAAGDLPRRPPGDPGRPGGARPRPAQRSGHRAPLRRRAGGGSADRPAQPGSRPGRPSQKR